MSHETDAGAKMHGDSATNFPAENPGWKTACRGADIVALGKMFQSAAVWTLYYQRSVWYLLQGGT